MSEILPLSGEPNQFIVALGKAEKAMINSWNIPAGYFKSIKFAGTCFGMFNLPIYAVTTTVVFRRPKPYYALLSADGAKTIPIKVQPQLFGCVSDVITVS